MKREKSFCSTLLNMSVITRASQSWRAFSPSAKLTYVNFSIYRIREWLGYVEVFVEYIMQARILPRSVYFFFFLIFHSQCELIFLKLAQIMPNFLICDSTSIQSLSMAVPLRPASSVFFCIFFQVSSNSGCRQIILFFLDIYQVSHSCNNSL